MVDDRQVSRVGAIILGAVTALMTTPAIGSADSPDADGGSADTRRAAASAPATAGRSLRATHRDPIDSNTEVS